MARFGLIGKNIDYSFSRTYFKEKFEGEGRNDTYENFDLPTADALAELLLSTPDVKGYNVTIPYKQAVMPYLDKNYRTSTFRIAVGHDLTANFMNYYLMKDPALFQGYISLSPDIAPQMEERLTARLGAIDQKLFYYLATGTEDIGALRNSIIQLDSQIKQVKNESLQYNFDNFELLLETLTILLRND